MPISTRSGGASGEGRLAVQGSAVFDHAVLPTCFSKCVNATCQCYAWPTGVFSVEKYFLTQMNFSVEIHKQGESQR